MITTIDHPTRADLAAAASSLRTAGETQHADRLLNRCDDLESPELRIVVFGEFSRGKSTLINALLGRRVLEAKAMPTTGHVTRIVHGEHEEVRALLRGGEIKACDLADLGSFTTLDLDRKAREDVEAIEVAVNCPLLRDGIALIDTPGVCDPGAQTERALAAMASADLVLLVLNASQLLTENEHELAVEWMVRGLDKAVVPVVNWMNVVEERDRPELRRRLDRWCHDHLSTSLARPWFEVNALAALRHVLENDPLPADHFGDLRTALEALKGPTRRHIQHRSRLGQLRAEVSEARRSNGNTLETIRRDANRVERERAESRRELRSHVDQLNAQARLKRQGVMTHAAHALDTRLERLTGHYFRNESKEQLEKKAHKWFENMLNEATLDIEKRTEAELLSLTGPGLRRPAPLTIREQMVLKARLQVGELKPTDATNEALGAGMVIGGIVGTFILPGFGTAIGVGVGRYLGNYFGASPPDYVAAFSEKARQGWKPYAADVTRLLGAQFDARVEALSRQLTEQLERAQSVAEDATGLAAEVSLREQADEALERSERALGPWAGGV